MSPPEVNQKASVKRTIKRIIDCLVNIKDETGEFLMTLPDGRVIDTKGWNDWEVSRVISPVEAFTYHRP